MPTSFVGAVRTSPSGPDNKIWFSGKFNGAGGVGRMDPANPSRHPGPRRLRRDPARAAIAAGTRRRDLARRQAPAHGRTDRPGDRRRSWRVATSRSRRRFNIRNLAPGPGRERLGARTSAGRSRKVDPAPEPSTTFDVPGGRELAVGHHHRSGREPLVHGRRTGNPRSGGSRRPGEFATRTFPASPHWRRSARHHRRAGRRVAGSRRPVREQHRPHHDRPGSSPRSAG